MFQQFDSARNFYYDVDENGTVRQLLHTHAPVDSKAHTPQLAAAEYLQEFGPALGLTPPQLKNLSQPPSSTLEDAPVEYRFHMEKHQFDSATVAFYQTDLGLPVWQAGVAVQMKVKFAGCWINAIGAQWPWGHCGRRSLCRNHFQPTCWKCEEAKVAAISRLPRPFPRT